MSALGHTGLALRAAQPLAATIERSRRERESWRYTDLEKLLAAVPANAVAPSNDIGAAQGPRLVFIDGVLSEKQSQFLGLPASILTGDAVSGYRLEVQKETCLVTQPLELLFVTTEGAQEIATRLRITLGESARLTLIERHHASHAPHVMESEIVLQKQAKLVHGKFVTGNTGAHLSQTKATVAAGAYYDNFTLIKGGALTRNEIDARLEGKLAQCGLFGAMLLRGRDHGDTTTRITHAAPFGTSREFYKSVIGGQARGVFQGKILVEKFAQKTDGHQLSRALLLSDQAEMDAKPELEIYADDVKCSHGSTVGDLDENALFYLRARGIDEKAARDILVQAFVGEIIDEIHANEIRDLCRAEVEGWLHG